MTTSRSGTFGLRNIGNSCFLNVVLQSLSTVGCFREFVSTAPVGVGRSTASILPLLQQYLPIIFDPSHEQTTSIDPRCFTEDQGLHRFFKSRQQQDAQEFMQELMTLIDKLTENSPEDTHYSLVPGLSARSTFLTRNPFVGWFGSKIKCGSCRLSRIRYDMFHDISLPIPVYATNLFQCLDEFTKSEELDDVYCDKCAKKTRSEKSLFFGRPPRGLCFHFRRLVSHHRQGLIKNRNHIEFPLYLDMTRFCRHPPAGRDAFNSINLNFALANLHSPVVPDGTDRVDYQLQSVIVHEGPATHGHYTVYRKNKHGEWTHVSDLFSESVTAERVKNVEAYMLFYERISRDSKSEELP